MNEASIATHDDPRVQPPPVARPATLEERIHRLEDVVATLQDTRHLEERIVEKVSTRIKRQASRAVQESTGIIVNAGRKLLPAVLGVARSETETAAPATEPATPARARSWVLYDFYAELRAMFRMYVDRRYRMSWMARTVPLAALVIVFLSWFLIASIWVVGPVLDKVLDLVLACLVYKLLAREVARYRQTIGETPAP